MLGACIPDASGHPPRPPCRLQGAQPESLGRMRRELIRLPPLPPSRVYLRGQVSGTGCRGGGVASKRREK